VADGDARRRQIMAASLSLAPVLIVYVLAQRYIVEGIPLTGQGGR
jgi:ABC-type glycerol-3-phosphate transport system permease component